MTKHVEKLAEQFLAGDDRGAIEYISTFLDRDAGMVELYDSLITPAMYYIGKLWETNRITVADEHLATATCDFVMTYLEQNRGPEGDTPGINKVMLFGVEEEQHYIGLKMAATIFRQNGWNVRYMGPDLPLQHAETAVNAWQPDVIGLSVGLAYRLSKLTETILSLSKMQHKPSIIIGGRVADKFKIPIGASNQIFIAKDLSNLDHWMKHSYKGGYSIDITN
ncbi:cobalamin-binding domain protein [Oceanobacillus piezotolerans]|uniref:Cobalamin-binding domain protein n=1 Tax=Oceanobacillus piezotolerans TaxID=2448030 RepID=A0A498DF25_9BACI|nr:B12-binding domain-containing protein [Oceanobacillus piezotolerans]RLL42129.1 cobalamin-binding domain protein [Oceanobacillus piezotolerans]